MKKHWLQRKGEAEAALKAAKDNEQKVLEKSRKVDNTKRSLSGRLMRKQDAYCRKLRIMQMKQ